MVLGYQGETQEFPLGVAQDLYIIEMLIDFGANVHNADANGDTALMLAIIREDNDSLVDYLIDIDESVIHDTNDKGMTALMLAALLNRPISMSTLRME